LAQIRDAERGAVRVRDLEVDHRVDFDVDIVASNDDLPANGDYLDFNVHNTERLRADVDLNQARVDRLVELAEA